MWCSMTRLFGNTLVEASEMPQEGKMARTRTQRATALVRGIYLPIFNPAVNSWHIITVQRSSRVFF